MKDDENEQSSGGKKGGGWTQPACRDATPGRPQTSATGRFGGGERREAGGGGKRTAKGACGKWATTPKGGKGRRGREWHHSATTNGGRGWNSESKTTCTICVCVLACVVWGVNMCACTRTFTRLRQQPQQQRRARPWSAATLRPGDPCEWRGARRPARRLP